MVCKHGDRACADDQPVASESAKAPAGPLSVRARPLRHETTKPLRDAAVLRLPCVCLHAGCRLPLQASLEDLAARVAPSDTGAAVSESPGSATPPATSGNHSYAEASERSVVPGRATAAARRSGTIKNRAPAVTLGPSAAAMANTNSGVGRRDGVATTRAREAAGTAGVGGTVLRHQALPTYGDHTLAAWSASHLGPSFPASGAQSNQDRAARLWARRGVRGSQGHGLVQGRGALARRLTTTHHKDSSVPVLLRFVIAAEPAPFPS